MTAWLSFWKWLLIGVIAVYALLALAVTVGGFRDLLRMLSRDD